MSKFDYPRLPRDEIIGALREIEIVVSDADLRHPNPDFVSDIYTIILSRLDILNEDYDQVDFSALDKLENPDLHRNSVRMMNLLRKMNEVLTAMDCPKKFILKDLMKPDADRTEIFLGALLNFSIHRNQKMELLAPMMEEIGCIEDQGKELEARVLQLNAEIDQLNESKEREMPLVHDVDAKVKVLRKNIPDLNNHQMSLKASIKKMKEKAKELDEKISSAEFALVQIVQENASLRSKIVQSPDKLLRTLEEKKVVLSEAKDAERASMQSYHEKNVILELYTKGLKKLSKCLSQTQAIQEKVTAVKSNEKTIKDLKDKQSKEDMLDKTLEAKLVERQGIVDRITELLRQLEKERDIKYEEDTKELNNVKFEVERSRLDLESRQKMIEAVVAEVDAITMKINAVKEAGLAKRQELLKKGEEIVTAFFAYSNSIGSRSPSMELEVGPAT